MGGLGDRFERLVEIVRRLRAPGGCPWDQEQTHDSLRPYVLEEAREVVAAIGEGRSEALCEELGDLLLQVALHAVIAEESQTFGPGEIIDGLADKLIRRHPHVFGGRTACNASDAAARWAEVKAEETARAPRLPSEAKPWLDAVPRGTTALVEARALGAKAGDVGFDWGDATGAWPKVGEELAEFEAAWRAWEASGQPEGAARGAVEGELGDLLFAAVNVARLLGIDPELALISTNEKFRARFAAVEQAFGGDPAAMRRAGLPALDRVWEQAKANRPSVPPTG